MFHNGLKGIKKRLINAASTTINYLPFQTQAPTLTSEDLDGWIETEFTKVDDQDSLGLYILGFITPKKPSTKHDSESEEMEFYSYMGRVAQFHDKHASEQELETKSNNLLSNIIKQEKIEENIDRLSNLTYLIAYSMDSLIADREVPLKQREIVRKFSKVQAQFKKNQDLDRAITAVFTSLIRDANEPSIFDELSFVQISQYSETIKKVYEARKKFPPALLNTKQNSLSNALDETIQVQTDRIRNALDKILSKSIASYEKTNKSHYEDTGLADSLAQDYNLVKRTLTSLETLPGIDLEVTKKQYHHINENLVKLEKMIIHDLNTKVIACNFDANKLKLLASSMLIKKNNKNSIAESARWLPQCAISILTSSLNDKLNSDATSMELHDFRQKAAAFLNAINKISTEGPCKQPLTAPADNSHFNTLEMQIAYAAKLLATFDSRIEMKPIIIIKQEEQIKIIKLVLDQANDDSTLNQLLDYRDTVQSKLDDIHQMLQYDLLKDIPAIKDNDRTVNDVLSSLNQKIDAVFDTIQSQIKEFTQLKNRNDIITPILCLNSHAVETLVQNAHSQGARPSNFPNHEDQYIEEQYRQLEKLKQFEGFFKNRIKQLGETIEQKSQQLQFHINENYSKGIIDKIQNVIKQCEDTKAQLQGELDHLNDKKLIEKLKVHLENQEKFNNQFENITETNNFYTEQKNRLGDDRYKTLGGNQESGNLIVTIEDQRGAKGIDEFKYPICTEHDSETSIASKLKDHREHINTIFNQGRIIQQRSIDEKPIELSANVMLSKNLSHAITQHNKQIQTLHREKSNVLLAYETRYCDAMRHYPINEHNSIAYLKKHIDEMDYSKINGDFFNKIRTAVINDPYYDKITKRSDKVGPDKKLSITGFMAAVHQSNDLGALLRATSPTYVNSLDDLHPHADDKHVMNRLRQNMPHHPPPDDKANGKSDKKDKNENATNFNSTTNKYLLLLEKNVKKYLEEELVNENKKMKSPKSNAIVNGDAIFHPDGSVNNQLVDKLGFEYDGVTFIYQNFNADKMKALNEIKKTLRNKYNTTIYKDYVPTNRSITNPTHLIQIYHEIAIDFFTKSVYNGGTQLSFFDKDVNITESLDFTGACQTLAKSGQTYLICNTDPVNKKTVCVKTDDFQKQHDPDHDTFINKLKNVNCYKELNAALTKIITVKFAEEIKKPYKPNSFFNRSAQQSINNKNMRSASKLIGNNLLTADEVGNFEKCSQFKKLVQQYNEKLPDYIQEMKNNTTCWTLRKCLN